MKATNQNLSHRNITDGSGFKVSTLVHPHEALIKLSVTGKGEEVDQVFTARELEDLSKFLNSAREDLLIHHGHEKCSEMDEKLQRQEAGEMLLSMISGLMGGMRRSQQQETADS